MASDVRCVVDSGDLLGEGPLWAAAEGRLYWFDIQGKRLNWHSSAREGLADEELAGQPLAGALFAFEPGVAGLALPAFEGEIGAPR
jgi:sugar lactone lactonase YvrE